MKFQKGKSGNPGGQSRAKKEFREACRELTDDALNALTRALNDPDNYVQAAKIVLEFGHGKPSQDIKHSFDALTDEQLEARYREIIKQGPVLAAESLQ